MIIAFSGMDGSGKTTSARFFYNYLKNKNFCIKYVHIIRDSFYHKILHNIVGKVSKKTQYSLENNLRTKEKGVLSFISKSIKKTALFINLMTFNLRYGGYKGNLKRNIIVDRYFYDDIVQGVYLGILGGRFLAAYNKFIIMPDIVFFLKAEPEMAYARKQEYDKDYYIQKSRIYTEVYSTIPHIEIPEGSMDSINDSIKNHLDKAIEGHD